MVRRALAIRYLNGEANDEEVSRLDEWLRVSSANALILAECAIDEQNLAEATKEILDDVEAREHEQQITPEMLAALLPKCEPEPVDITRIVLEKQSERALALHREEERLKALHSEASGDYNTQVVIVPRPVLWLATAAALGLIAWLGASLFSGDNHSPEIGVVDTATQPKRVAEVKSGSRVVWADPTVLTKGLFLGEEVELISGVAEVSFEQGAVVLIQGPTSFTPTSTNALHLTTGKLIAEVPPSAAGFEVDTSLGLIRDYGTEFGVQMDSAAGLQMHVFEGEIGVMLRYSDNTLGDETKLLANEAAKVSPGEEAIRLEESQVAHYIRRAEYTLRITDDLTAAERMRAHLYELDRSANMIAHLSFSDGQMSVHQGPAGQDFKAEWIGGEIVPIKASTHGTEVMRLDGAPEQGIDIIMPAKEGYEKLTFIVWARVEPIAGRTNAPLLHHSRIDMPRSVPNWQLRPDLDQVHVNQFAQSGTAARTRRASASVQGIVWEDWHCFAVVIDARTGKCEHYLDGRSIGSGEIEQQVPLKLDGLRIASSGREVTNHPRTIKGHIGQFTFLNTTLDDEGIRQMYKASRQLFE